MIEMKFKEFIEKKFVEWQNDQGKRKSVADFAAYLGISQPLLSMWMNGSKKPGAQNIKLLYQLYGDEIAEILGIDSDYQYIQTYWSDLPPSTKKSIREQIKEYVIQKKEDE